MRYSRRRRRRHRQSGAVRPLIHSRNIDFQTGTAMWDGVHVTSDVAREVKLAADSLEVDDDFTPADFQQLNDRDVDLGILRLHAGARDQPADCRSKKGTVYVLKYADPWTDDAD